MIMEGSRRWNGGNYNCRSFIRGWMIRLFSFFLFWTFELWTIWDSYGVILLRSILRSKTWVVCIPPRTVAANAENTQHEQPRTDTSHPDTNCENAKGNQGCNNDNGNGGVVLRSQDGRPFQGGYWKPQHNADQKGRGNNQPIDPSTLPGACPIGNAGVFNASQGTQ